MNPQNTVAPAPQAPERNTPRFDTLMEFANWWIRHHGPIPLASPTGMHRVGGVSVVTLYQDQRFQVQLCLCDPNSEITPHAHPGVELLKVYVCGQIYLKVNGEPIVTQEKLDRVDGDMWGAQLRIGEHDTHEAKIGQLGGCFITIQHHLREPVKSLQLCWEGAPLDENHARALQTQKVKGKIEQNLQEWNELNAPQPTI